MELLKKKGEDAALPWMKRLRPYANFAHLTPKTEGTHHLGSSAPLSVTPGRLIHLTKWLRTFVQIICWVFCSKTDAVSFVGGNNYMSIRGLRPLAFRRGYLRLGSAALLGGR